MTVVPTTIVSMPMTSAMMTTVMMATAAVMMATTAVMTTATMMTSPTVMTSAAMVTAPTTMTTAAVMATAVATATSGKGFGWQHQRGDNSQGESSVAKHFVTSHDPDSGKCHRLSQFHSKSRWDTSSERRESFKRMTLASLGLMFSAAVLRRRVAQPD